MSDETIFANARLVLETEIVTGSLVLKDGLIEKIDSGKSVPAGSIDCDGDLLAPGLIELHTDNLERHLQPRPAVDWPHDAAILAHDAELAGCGITTVFDALRVGSIHSSVGVGYKPYARALATELMALRAAGHLRISHHIHLRAEVCSQTLAAELEAFGPEDRVGLLSLMDHTPGQRQFADKSKLAEYMKGKHGITDARFEEYCGELVAMQQEFGKKHEAATIAAAKRLGAALASHDDTTAAQVQTSAAYDVNIAEFPTTMEAAQACHDSGIAVMMGAPNIVRGGSHSGNVAASALAEAGLLDILSSDYIPAALLTATMQLARQWGNLPAAMACVTATPARAVGLTDRGRLAEGLRADIVQLREVGERARPMSVWSAGRRVA